MGEIVDGRADQYALAATIYHLLTGRQLFPHSNPAVVISHQLSAAPPKLADIRKDLAEFDAALAVALSKNPHDRFTRASDFARALIERTTSPSAAVTATAPTQSARVAPRIDSEATDHPRRSQANSGLRRSPVFAVTAAVLVVIVVAVMAWHPWSRGTGTAAPPSASHPANTGLLTGVYSADFSPEVEMSKDKVLNPLGAHGTFEIRSACTPSGCMAIAKATSGPMINRTLIFDEIDGEWVSVGTGSSTSPAISIGLNADCEQGLSPEVWETLSLQPQINRTLTGQYEIANANNCNTTRTVTLTRTGDVDMTSIDDPATLQPRKPSPAAGFRGHYRYTYSKLDFSHDVVGYVQTRCLHTGERCMSYFSEPKSAEPFVFARDRWALQYSAPVSCGGPTGPRVRIERSAELELPQPLSDPIDLLVGQGQEEVSNGSCRLPLSGYNLRFARTGD